MKKCVVLIFCLTIFLPLSLNCLSIFTGIAMDMPLKGYYETVEKPVFTGASFFSGEYQQLTEEWIKESHKPRGLMTVIYNTIQYNLFQLGNRIVGKNGDIFESAYIEAELCLNDENNYALEDNEAALKEYVMDLQEIQHKLKQHGKDLYVYITPSKAVFNFDNIPGKYIGVKPENTVRAVDLFHSEIVKTDVPCFFCTDMADELQYPAFYTTGIHWARTYEQMASKRILEQLSEVSGKQYPDFQLGSVKESKEPFWRDTDVYDLLNVFNKSTQETYYEYHMIPRISDQDSRMRILLQGGSFAEGLLNDITSNFPTEEVYYINYNVYLRDHEGIIIPIENNDWNNVDFKKYLDMVDIVAIELNEAVINRYSRGFVDYLNGFLNLYESGDSEAGGAGEDKDFGKGGTA